MITAVRSLPQAGGAQAGLLAPATVRKGARSVEVAAEVLPAFPSWTSSLVSGTLGGGIVLARKAAADLEVGVGSCLPPSRPRMPRRMSGSR